MGRSRTATKHLMRSKIRESGLTPTCAERDLGFSYLSRPATEALGEGFEPRVAMRIPYHDRFGKATGFFRVRYLEPPSGMKALLRKDPQKYTQPSGTTPEVYLPPLVRWDEILDDPTEDVVITEGELKAAKATFDGFATIGLGGVFSFGSKKLGLSFLPELASVVWSRRNVFLVFDSDVRTNEQVATALARLSRELEQRGALVRTVYLPEVEGLGKTGLDDYLVAKGADAFEALLDEAANDPRTSALAEVNERFAVIDTVDGIVDLRTRTVSNVSNFKTLRLPSEVTFLDPVSGKPKTKKLADLWLAWPNRRVAPELRYEPGRGMILEDGSVNLWKGWGVDPADRVEVPLDPFFRLVDRFFVNDDSAKEWFLRWCAVQFQVPGIKLFSAVLFYSRTHGVGKSWLGQTLGRVFGPDNFSEIAPSDLASQFNSWAAKKQFVLADEVVTASRRVDSSKLKNLITQNKLTVNEKYSPRYVLENRVNYMLTSNDPVPIYVEDADRRFFVWEVVANERFDSEEANVYRSWIEDDVAMASLHRWFLEFDLGDFNPSNAAYETTARADLIELGRSDLEDFAHDLATNPNGVLLLDGVSVPGDVWSLHRLLDLFHSRYPTYRNDRSVTPKGLARALRREGVRFVRATTFEGFRTLYALRDRDRYAGAEPRVFAAEYARAFRDETSEPPARRGKSRGGTAT